MTQEEVWALVLNNEKLLKREIGRYVPRRLNGKENPDFDVAYSDVVIARAHDIMATFKPELGNLPITHLCANARWYAYKWVHRRCYKAVPEPASEMLSTMDPAASNGELHEIQLHVAQILEEIRQVDATAAKILEWHLLKGYTLDEIADHFDPPISRKECRQLYEEAVALAQGLGAYKRISRWLELLLEES